MVCDATRINLLVFRISPISSRRIDCEDVIIRDGVRALAAKWWLQLKEKELESQDWTLLQISEVLLKAELKKIEEKISIYTNQVEQDATLLHFREYAYQWY